MNEGVTPAVAGHKAERALVFGGTAHIENKRLDREPRIRGATGGAGLNEGVTSASAKEWTVGTRVIGAAASNVC
jgi:hypothetical protein